MFSGIEVGSDDPTDPTADPVGVCNLTPIRLFFDMWDSYDPDPDFNNLGSNYFIRFIIFSLIHVIIFFFFFFFHCFKKLIVITS